MGLEIEYIKPETMEMLKSYDEKTTARLFSTSDHRFIVTEGDVRARFLVAIHGPVSRADARIIRGYRNGAEFLEPINPADVPAEEAKAAPAAPDAPKADAAPGEGPDFIIDWGTTYKGKRLGDMTDKYLASLTKGKSPADRKAMALAEIERRKAPAAPAAPPAPDAPLTYGPDDEPNIGVHQNVAVKELPEDFLKRLADGEDTLHKTWAATELQRRIDEA